MKSTEKPNIIFIITDQQRYDTIAGLGYPHMDTPNLDRLVREGVTLTNCHITAASCAPARASLFTGYYPHTTGILKNADTWQHSWIEKLREGGYHCANIGKMHTWPFTTDMGFNERYVIENKDRYWEGRYFFDEWDKAMRFRGLVKQQRDLYRQWPEYRECMGAFDWKLPEDAHPDNFAGDLATWWIRNYPKTEPLFLQIGFPGPHPPYDPVPRYAEKYMEKELPLQAVTQEDLDGQPPAFKELREHNAGTDHDSVVHLLDPTDAQRHKQRAYYLANVTMIDEKVGEIMDALEDSGYLDNTIVIFTSDHGDCLTDHGHVQKWTMYEQITHVPVIIWSPKRFEGGTTLDLLCQQMDLGPTILDWAGLKPSFPLEAISLLPALEGDETPIRTHVFAEQAKDPIFTGSEFMTMVRDDDWKLVHFLDEPHGQLFNLIEDPDEFRNLWDDPEFADKKEELLAVLREWRIRSQYETADLSSKWR